MPAWVSAARALERGRFNVAATRLLSQAWELAANPVRVLQLPDDIVSIGVGGATLGGAGKTPLAVAVARAVATSGRRVVLIGHAHGASPGRGQVVLPGSEVGVAGDEAIVCARAVRDLDITVVVAETRASAVAFARTLSPEVLVFDGMLQARPTRVSLSLLACDPQAPWGSGFCPPAGDLRASVRRLNSASDLAVTVSPDAADGHALRRTISHLRFARSGERVDVRTFLQRHRDVAVATTIARPQRLLGVLRELGFNVTIHVCGGDHRPLNIKRSGTTPWLVTEKCALQLGPDASANVWILEEQLDLSPLMLETLSHLFRRTSPPRLDRAADKNILLGGFSR